MSDLLIEKLAALSSAGVSPGLVDRIHRFVADDPAPRLFRISPYRLAQEWEIPPKCVLDAFLLGTRLGIFDLEWSIRCGSCFGPADIQKTLSDLKNHARCAGCRVDIQNAALDAHVEVNFTVGRGVRSVEPPLPSDVIAAWVKFDLIETLTVPPGEEWVRELDLASGAYKIFTEDFVTRAAFLLEGEGPPREKEIFFDYGAGGIDWHAAARPPGRYAIRVRNSSDRPLRMHFARAPETPWVSGLDVASNQHFRDMFSEELISTEVSFGVRNVVLLFTDIRGSTNLYERRGDARAYALVSEHFKILFDSVRRHNGALVKTIGDAVMASFVAPADALAAILEAHDRFDAFNRAQASENAIVIKAGLHAGACIAVTLNETLDYFGRMVNLAARIQGESKGGDIVLSRTLFECAGISKQSEAAGWSAAEITGDLKGIERPIPLTLLTRRAEKRRSE